MQTIFPAVTHALIHCLAENPVHSVYRNTLSNRNAASDAFYIPCEPTAHARPQCGCLTYVKDGPIPAVPHVDTT